MTLDITTAAIDPALLDLLWDVPFEEWPPNLLVALPRGIPRHIVHFVNPPGRMSTIKGVGLTVVHHKYDCLYGLTRLNVPSI